MGHQKRRSGHFILKAAISVVVLVGTSLGLVAVLDPGAESASTASADTFTVSRLSFDITTTSMGDIEARNRTEIASKVETRTSILEVIPEGTYARKGDQLIRLDPASIEKEIKEEELRVTSVQASVDAATEDMAIQISENESQISQAELKVTTAALDMAKWRFGDLEIKNEELEVALERAERELDRKHEKYLMTVDLFEQGFASKDALQQDHLAWTEQIAELVKAQLGKDTFWEYEYPKLLQEKESAVTEAQKALERVRREGESRLSSKRADLVAKQRTLELQTENLAKLKEQLASTVITAPQDGLVVYTSSMNDWDDGRGPLKVGRDVYPNEPLIVLPDPSELITRVRVHETMANKIHEGLQANLRIDALPGRTFVGTVIKVGVLAEAGNWRSDPNLREYSVQILIHKPEDGPAIKPSGRCEAEILLGKAEAVVAVPVQSVFTEGRLRFVYLREGDRFSKRPVLTGQTSVRYAEIRAGLSEGDVVLLREPSPAEVITRPWDAEQLAAVGMKLNDLGDVVPDGVEGGRGRRGPGGRAASLVGGPEGRGGQAAPDAAAVRQPPADTAIPAANPSSNSGASPETDATPIAATPGVDPAIATPADSAATPSSTPSDKKK